MPTFDALMLEARAAFAHLDTPALDARLLLQHVTGLSQADLIARSDEPVSDANTKAFRALVERRARHEPVSRIIGAREFYGRQFEVTPDVLDPRADTEVLIEAALALLPQDKPLRLLDLGTGSGIIAITLLAERPIATALAIDVSDQALEAARRNAAQNGVTLETKGGSWFEGVEGTFDAILSNPPYIETSDIAGLSRDVRDHDPHVALDGGEDGLQCYRVIASQAGQHLKPSGFVAVEIGAGQADDVVEIFRQNGFVCRSTHRDLAGHTRCLVFNLAEKMP
jgi:release factor glutamine methyltransferase